MRTERSYPRFDPACLCAPLLIVTAALANSALANSGTVYFAAGSVSAQNADGKTRPLVKGAEVRTGDHITSGADARAQIRFSDGGYVSLQPGSDLEIKDYRFDGAADGKDAAVFTLSKGALRAITGLVHDNYRIETPSATVTSRGTGGVVQIGNDGSTRLTSTSGVWSLANHGGALDIPAGTTGFAGSDASRPPKRSDAAAALPPREMTLGTPEPQYVQGDVVNAQGQPVSVPAPSVVAFNFVLSAGTLGQTSSSGVSLPTDPTTFNSAGQLTRFVAPVFTLAPGGSGASELTQSGSQVDSGTDGLLAWGRWIGDIAVRGVRGPSASGTVLTGPNQGLHYVAGIPTPTASMPAGGSFTYNVIGATSPTFASGAIAPGHLNSATLTASFATLAARIDLSLSAGGEIYAGSATGRVFGNSFGGSGLTVTSSGGVGCAPTCFLSVSGFFAGPGATHAGLEYLIATTLGSLGGAAALQR